MSPAQKQIIKWAADEQGVSMTSFVANAALHRAYSTVNLSKKREELIAMAAKESGVSEQDFKDHAILDVALKILHKE